MVSLGEVSRFEVLHLVLAGAPVGLLPQPQPQPLLVKPVPRMSRNALAMARLTTLQRSDNSKGRRPPLLLLSAAIVYLRHRNG